MRKAVLFLALLLVLLPLLGSGEQIGVRRTIVSDDLPTFILPDTNFVSLSTTCDIWSDQVAPTMPGLAPWFLRASSDTAGGSKLTKRGWRWTPAAAASKTLRYHALDPDGAVLRADSVLVRAVSNTAGWGRKRILFVGDSVMADTISGRGVVREVLRLANVVNAHGDSLISIGPNGFAGFNYVAHSGLRWHDFDAGTHADYNPFRISGKLDFKTWMTTNRSEPTFNGLDYAVFLLGLNDMANWALGHERVTASDLAHTCTHIDSLCAALLDADTGYPGCKIILCTLPIPANDLSAIGSSYRAARFYGSIYQQNIRDYNRAIIARYDAGAWNARVDVCDAGAWVDRIYGYPHALAAPNARNGISGDREFVYSNYVHPDSVGHYEMADAIYGHLCGKRAEETQRNLIGESENVANVLTWAHATNDSLLTAPNGMTDAQRFLSDGAAVAYGYEPCVMGASTCASAYFHLGPGGATIVGRLVFNGGGGTTLTVDFNIASGNTVSLISTPGPTFAFGSAAVSNGWVRVYVTDLIAADVGKTMNVSIYIDRSGTAIRRVGLWGLQFETGVSAPTAYQSRP